MSPSIKQSHEVKIHGTICLGFALPQFGGWGTLMIVMSIQPTYPRAKMQNCLSHDAECLQGEDRNKPLRVNDEVHRTRGNLPDEGPQLL